MDRRILKQAERWRANTVGTCKTATAKAFQKVVRMEAANDQGVCQCVTCPNEGHWKNVHAGHFIAGRKNSILFEPRNVHVQCVRCNTYLGGNQEMYSVFMVGRYGQSTVDELNALRLVTLVFDREQLARMIVGYRDRIKIQAARVGK